MGRGTRQIQDSQRGVINKSAHKEGGDDFPFLFYFQTNTFSALGINGTLLDLIPWEPGTSYRFCRTEMHFSLMA